MKAVMLVFEYFIRLFNTEQTTQCYDSAGSRWLSQGWTHIQLSTQPAAVT